MKGRLTKAARRYLSDLARTKDGLSIQRLAMPADGRALELMEHHFLKRDLVNGRTAYRITEAGRAFISADVDNGRT